MDMRTENSEMPASPTSIVQRTSWLKERRPRTRLNRIRQMAKKRNP